MNESTNIGSPLVVMADDDAGMIHQYSSMVELSKGFAASQSSSTLDETVSNSSLGSSSFSLSSAFSSAFLNDSLRSYKSKRPLVTALLMQETQPPPLSKDELKVSTSAEEMEKRSGVLHLRGMSPRKLLENALFNRQKAVWEEIEDRLFILLDGRLDRLLILREFYFERNLRADRKLGRKRCCEFLWSFGYLFSSKPKDMVMHDEHISRFASFLSTGRDAQHLKLAVTRTLYKMCTSSPEHGNCSEKKQNGGSQPDTEKLFDFLMNRVQEWDDVLVDSLSEEAFSLVYELRAKCLRNLELERHRIKSVTDKGDNTAIIIAAGAKVMEMGIQKSNKVIEGRISKAGQKMKSWIDDVGVGGQHGEKKSRIQQSIDDRDGLMIRTLSGSTKRASEHARQNSKRIAQSTLDTTISGLYTIGNKVEESTDNFDHLSPENREMIKAAGKIGIASVGAVAVVAEAVMETSRSLSSKTVGVTADIVGHTYGSVAGEVARDAADTYTNVLQTMGNVNLTSNGSKLIKTAAKNAGKNQNEKDVEKAKQIIMRLERHGAIVAKQTLGIQWIEGTLTKELLYDAVSNDEREGSISIHPKPNISPDYGKNLLV